MELSIVIPVFNEGRKVDKDLLLATRFLEERGLSGEIILSDDGSTDDTLDIPEQVSHQIKVPLRIFHHAAHKGKGSVVRAGILKAQGDVVLFIDSGACVPYDDVLPGLEMIRTGACDIAHGSRFLPTSTITKKPWHREILSFLFRKFIVSWIKVPYELTDTQCGLKMYRKEVAQELYKQCLTEGFMFDIEIILRAGKASYHIREFPVTWTADPDSRLSVAKTFLSIIPELQRIKRYV
jgi:dolichyl-phosphate beta-glucosyltransferase